MDTKSVYPESNMGKTETVAVFHNEIIFRANEDQWFCWLWNNEQVIKPKSAVRGVMLFKFVCLFHGNMVDPDTGKSYRVILNYGKNYDEYWTGEDVAIQILDPNTTFINIHPGYLPLYVFNNSSNHHKMDTNDINERNL